MMSGKVQRGLHGGGGDGVFGRRVVCLTRGVPESYAQALQEFSGSAVQEHGAIRVGLAREQHAQYVDLLRKNPNVARVVELGPDKRFPDCMFIEDTAVVANGTCVITQPGAASRKGEEEATLAAMRQLQQQAQPSSPSHAAVADLHTIKVMGKDWPGATCDGGDVLVTDSAVYVGLSSRTNEAGFQALKEAFEVPGASESDQSMLSKHGAAFQVVPVDLRENDCLHLKSVVTWMGFEAGFVVADTPEGHAAWAAIETSLKSRGLPAKQAATVPLPAANILRIGDTVYYPSNQPAMAAEVGKHLLSPVAVDNSEAQKADGALTCCSIVIPVKDLR